VGGRCATGRSVHELPDSICSDPASHGHGGGPKVEVQCACCDSSDVFAPRDRIDRARRFADEACTGRYGAAGFGDLVPAVRCRIVRWISDEPQPGLVEASITDVDGRVWRFIDKSAIFSSEVLVETTEYPRFGVIRCEVIGSQVLPSGTMATSISTSIPDDIESTEGEQRFLVWAEEVDLT
jgi:hypothetical protein